MAQLNSNPNNPFQDTDFLTEVVREDVSIQTKSKQAFKQFITKYYHKPQPQTLNFMSRIFKTISTHSTAFIIGLVLAGWAVGASAAQLTAPDQYKPLTIFNELFKSNKQVEKNPYTALKPDANNDVVKVEECDLAIKYPKMLKDVKVDSFELDPDQFFDKTTNGVWLSTLPDLNKQYEEQKMINTFNIQCATVNPIQPDYESGYEIVKTEDFQKLTGWFITAESNLGTIRTVKFSSESKGSSTNYIFEYNKKFYEVQIFTEESIKAQGYDKNYTDQLLNAGGIYADQVQIQFNSLVSNESNVKPKPAQKPVKNDNKQAIDIKLKNESILSKYINDLATVKAESPESFICGVPNAITYTTEKKNGTIEGSMMTIGNKKDYINDKNLNNSYNRVLTYLNNQNDKLTDTLTSAFTTFCAGGYYSTHIQDISGIKYPKTDQFKAVLVRQGQGEFSDAVVLVYARISDNIVQLRKSISKEMTDEEKQKQSDEINKQCPFPETGVDEKYTECLKPIYAKLNAEQETPAKLAEAKIEAQKLVDLFAIQ